MKILYVNVIEQHAHWGAEYFVNQGFHRLGHTTFCIDYRQHRYHLAERFLQAPPVDAFLLQRGDGFPLPLIRAVQTPRFLWASELVSRCRDQDRLLRSGLFTHAFFRTDACIETVVARNWLTADRCSILRSGFDETVYVRQPDVPKEIDILFVGSVTPRRCAILEALAQAFKVTVASAFGAAAADLMNRSKIVLNIHAESFLDTETRVYEVLGCGAFLLTEQLSPENPFTEKELVQYTTTEDLWDKLAYYLAHEDERIQIAQTGYQAALANHTYTARAQEIVDVMARYGATLASGTSAPCYNQSQLRRYRVYEPVVRGGATMVKTARNVGRVLKRKAESLL